MSPISKNLKFSLKIKIAFTFLMLVIVVMVTVTYIFTIREINLRVEQVKLRMERLANNIATIRSVETEDWEMYQSYIENQIKLNPDIVFIAIYDEKNNLRAYELNRNWIEIESDRPLTNFEKMNIILRLDNRQIAQQSQKDLESKSVNIIIGDQNLGTVKVGFSLVELNDEKKNNLYRNLELAVIFILLAIVASYFLSQRIVGPLNKLTAAMLKISEGDLNQELHIDSRDEIGEMAETFNFMTAGLREKELIENFSHQLGFSIEFEKITNLTTERITRALNGNQGFLFLNKKDEPNLFYSVSAYPENCKKQIVLKAIKQNCDQFLKCRKPLFLNQLKKRSKVEDQLRNHLPVNDKTLISPIIISDKVIGIFILIKDEEAKPFAESDKSLLNTLIKQAALAIENGILLNELTEQERLKRELEIARAVQIGLLPQSNPNPENLDIDGICLPATEIGGDYFDYFQLDDHKFGVVIADVTGKGTSAAFYMAVVKGIMLSLTPIFNSPKDLLIELNKRLYGNMDRRIFITMIYAIFDTRANKLIFARAGHNSLIQKKNNTAEVELYTPPGIGLGLNKGDIFAQVIAEKEIRYSSGDLFIFFTDGITEAMNLNKHEFGEIKLLEILTKFQVNSSVQLREKIIHNIRDFVKDAPQHDDMTMVTIMAT